MVNTVRPKAIEMPTKPIPNSGNPAANTALPQPPSTSQSVPINSATSFFINIELSYYYLQDQINTEQRGFADL